MKKKSILTIAFSTFIAVSIAAINARRPNPVLVSVENAKDALMQLQEWAKWMSGLQTAAIAALWLLITDKESRQIKLTDRISRTIALTGFLFLGSAIFCSGWILSSIPSQIIRLSDCTDTDASVDYDVYERELYGIWPWIKLGHLLALNHWYWGVGLICVGIMVVYKFANTPIEIDSTQS